MPACIYCGKDAGPYDEHEECVELALEGALDDAEEAEAEEADDVDHSSRNPPTS